jgi:multidrug resistance efflux pump
MDEETSKPESAETNPETSVKKDKKDTKSKSSPVRLITFIVLLISVFFFIWYILSDRIAPYTDQARIKGLTVPIVSTVSGNITRIHVQLHSKVKVGDTLFQIDRRPFHLAVEKAEANLDNTAQGVAAQTASVKSAVGRLGVSRAQLDRAQRNWERVQKVMEENPGALSQSDRDQAETAYTQAVEHVTSAEADLERTQQTLGVSGPSNPEFISALKALEEAQLDLAYTTIIATAEGYIESFSIDLGYYAGAGQPLATLVSHGAYWIEADMKENNISLMKPGNEVEFSLDVRPGKIFHGTVKSIGYGVSTGSTNRGDLPDVKGSTGWLLDPQRFPVIISFNPDDFPGQTRIGGQVDVLVFTKEKRGFIEFLGKLRIRLISWLSYVR